ncbi:MAG: hypothetical protein WAT93_03660 [Pontixanthobacter sp.]
MKKTGRIFAFLTGLAAMIATPAMAEVPNAVKLSGDVMVVKTTYDDAAGKSNVELVKPDLVVPGDRLIFRTNFSNVSDEVVENFVVTNPLPSGVALSDQNDDAAEPAFVVSIDQGKTFGDLASLQVMAEDGTVRPAQSSDVTHVRWTLARLLPGEEGQITFYAIVR